jgi:hypothetical protein
LIVLLVLLLALAAVIVIRRIPSQPVARRVNPQQSPRGLRFRFSRLRTCLPCWTPRERGQCPGGAACGASSAEYVTRNGAPAIALEVCRRPGQT